MKKQLRMLAGKSLVWMVLAGMMLGFSGPASAGWNDEPDALRPPEVFEYSEEEAIDAEQDYYNTPLFYVPDVYETHRITGYSAVALTALALVTGDDSTFHKMSGVAAAVFGVAAGASGHIAYGEGIDFRDGWTRENIHAGSGYLATAALVLAAALGAADEDHGTVGGIATAAVTVPVIVFAF